MTITAASTETDYLLIGTALGPFATVFPYQTADDVKVYVTQNRATVLLARGADYTLTPTGDPLANGGAVLLNAGLPGAGWAAGATLGVVRATSLDQPGAFGEALAFSPQALEQGLDHVARQAQDLDTAGARVVARQPGAPAYSAQNRVIGNLAAGTAAADAVTLAQLQDAAGGFVAAAAAVKFTATSTSNVVIATGAKAFTIETAKSFQPGQFILATATADASKWMFGQVASYNASTGALVITVALAPNAGTFASWNIAMSGPQGSGVDAATLNGKSDAAFAQLAAATNAFAHDMTIGGTLSVTGNVSLTNLGVGFGVLDAPLKVGNGADGVGSVIGAGRTFLFVGGLTAGLLSRAISFDRATGATYLGISTWGGAVVDHAVIGQGGHWQFNGTVPGGWSTNTVLESVATGGALDNALSGWVKGAGVVGTAGLWRVDNVASYLASFYYSTGMVGSITTDASSITVNYTSDGRKKTKAGVYDPGDVFDRIEIWNYTWTSSGLAGVGPIAQDLHAVAPGLVRPGDANPDLRPGDEGYLDWTTQINLPTAMIFAELKALRARLAAAGIA